MESIIKTIVDMDKRARKRTMEEQEFFDKADSELVYYNLGVTYDFGVTKLSGAFMYKDGEDTDTVPNFWVAQIGAATPMLGGRWSVSASMLSNETQDDADAYSLGTRFDYPLSKRTKVYVGYEVVFNDDNAKYSVEAGPDSSLHYANEWGQTQGQFFMGINHKF